jgi:hypothetical protein
MKLRKYLDKTKQNPNSFSEIHNLPPVTVWRASKGKPIRPVMAMKIERITGGQVTFKDLLIP